MRQAGQRLAECRRLGVRQEDLDVRRVERRHGGATPTDVIGDPAQRVRSAKVADDRDDEISFVERLDHLKPFGRGEKAAGLPMMSVLVINARYEGNVLSGCEWR